jgi:hypothetical protein
VGRLLGRCVCPPRRPAVALGNWVDCGEGSGVPVRRAVANLGAGVLLQQGEQQRRRALLGEKD